MARFKAAAQSAIGAALVAAGLAGATLAADNVGAFDDLHDQVRIAIIAPLG